MKKFLLELWGPFKRPFCSLGITPDCNSDNNMKIKVANGDGDDEEKY